MFNKRIFNLWSFVSGLRGLATALPDSINARRGGRISHKFAEKLRLAATSVNRCKYCSYAHTMLAMRAQIPKEEIDSLLMGEIGCADSEYEAPGLLFAQHYAEYAGKPEASMVYSLKEAYGEKLSRDIITFLREIQFGNLSGNTFEAFLSRLAGDSAKGSSALFEAFFFIVSLPIEGPLHLAMKAKARH